MNVPFHRRFAPQLKTGQVPAKNLHLINMHSAKHKALRIVAGAREIVVQWKVHVLTYSFMLRLQYRAPAGH